MIFSIDGRPIGVGHPPYVIAELSANHNGSIERALQTVKGAHSSGAHALFYHRVDQLICDQNGMSSSKSVSSDNVGTLSIDMPAGA